VIVRPTIVAASGQAELVNVEDVEICQTGIEYPLASGPATFTTADLADAVEAQDDAAIKQPRIKLGHLANIGILEDGQPAIGVVSDMHLEQGGHLIMGTLARIPSWLANILPSAYPARSIEAGMGVETVTGHNWRMAITDLALLGVVWPGVTTLEDIQALYSKNGPDNLTVLTTKEEVAALSPIAAKVVTAQVDVDDVLRGYRDAKSPDQFWWWVRSMYMDPNELIVEDEDNGDLYRVPFTVKGEDVEFSDPVPVKIKYVDKSKPKEDKQAARLRAMIAANMIEDRHPAAKQLVRFDNREEHDRMTIVASGVDPVALRNALGLDENASDEDVRSALAAEGIVTPPPSGSGPAHHEVPEAERAPGTEQPGTSAEPGPGERDVTPGNGPNDPETGPSTQPPPGTGEQPPASPPGREASQPRVAPDGTVRLDLDTYNMLVRGAQAGEQAFRRQQHGDRDQVIRAAVEQGRIPPSRMDHWRNAWERDSDGTRHLLTATVEQGGLAPGLIPVAPKGAEPPTEDTSVEAYPADWLPEVKRGGQS
jgi:hypothetical protein